MFARLFSKDAIFVAVAGTNSYLSAVEGDDIDYYCITKTDGMWAFMLKALILSRIRSLREKGAPPLCFSYVMDERQARDEPRAEDRRPRPGHAHREGDLRRGHLPRDPRERALDEVVLPRHL